MSRLECGAAKAGPGEKAWGVINVREGAKRARIPVCVVNGAADGEHVVVLANMHGREINGLEAARRFAEQVDPRKLKGSVFVIASANPHATMFRRQYWPEKGEQGPREPDESYQDKKSVALQKRYSMSPRWPGAKGKLLVDRIVYEVWRRAVMAPHRKASLFLDVHGHMAPSAVYAANAWNIGLCVATGVGVVLNVRSGLKRTLSNKVCFDHGIANMTIELGGQNALSSVSIEDGRRAIFNMLKFWGMLRGRPEYPETTVILDAWRDDFEERKYANPSHCPVEALRRGIVVPCKKVYDSVRKGELICYVVDPYTAQVTQECRAPISGAIYSMYTHAHRSSYGCEKGDPLFAVSYARRVPTAEFVKRLDPDAIRRDPLRGRG